MRRKQDGMFLWYTYLYILDFLPRTGVTEDFEKLLGSR